MTQRLLNTDFNSTLSSITDQKQDYNNLRIYPKKESIILLLCSYVCFFLVCIYDLAYSVMHFSKIQCIDDSLFILFIIVSSCEIIVLPFIFLNFIKEWKQLTSPTLGDNLESCVLMCSINFQICIIAGEIIISICTFVWAAFHYNLNCDTYFGENAMSVIFLIIRFIFGVFFPMFLILLCAIKYCICDFTW